MNLVDLAILLIMAVSMVVGMYNGFLLSSLHTASFFILLAGSSNILPFNNQVHFKIYPSLLQVITSVCGGKCPHTQRRRQTGQHNQLHC